MRTERNEAAETNVKAPLLLERPVELCNSWSPCGRFPRKRGSPC